MTSLLIRWLSDLVERLDTRFPTTSLFNAARGKILFRRAGRSLRIDRRAGSVRDLGADPRLLETVRQHLGDPDPRPSLRLDDCFPHRPAQLAGTLAGIARSDAIPPGTALLSGERSRHLGQL